MKKLVLCSVSVCAALLVGCADSGEYGQGGSGAVQTESEAESTIDAAISTEDPGVAAETGTAGAARNESAESRFDTLGSTASPSATAPANVVTNATPEAEDAGDSAGSAPSNEQGEQISPEPETGDDANPDSVQPEI